tara:strand:- start:1 stop:432 length:432 start_codon:yes stop_codon:yes gene_type:complete
MPIKSFRGLIADGTQDTVVLHTNTGSTGYRIVKFLIMPYDHQNEDYESLVKIYKVAPAAIDRFVNFSDQTLLAAGQWGSSSSNNVYPDDMTVIFDGEIFNQDIYITNEDQKTNTGMNYYIELEQIKLDLNENTVATLKDIRNS